MGSIEIAGISRKFRNTTAVDGIDLMISDGEFLVLLGPSGCGKTTLLRMLAGLLPPTQGRISVDGRDVTAEPSKKRDLAMVFQSYALYPHLSVARNLAFPLRMQRVSKAETDTRVTEVARMLEIEHLLQRKPRELSGGQRQRVAVGRALVRNPRAFLMDEPLSNLDAKLRTATRHELTQLHRRLGATFVYVTHDQVEAMTMATRIAVLNEGRLEQVGAPAEVYDRPASVFVAGFLGSPAMNLLEARVDTDDGRVRLAGEGIEGTLWSGETPAADVTLGIRPEHLTIRSTSAPAADEGVSMDATVETVENLGSELVVYAQVAGKTVAVRTSRALDAEPGDQVRLSAPLRHVHLFDHLSGRRLDWVEPTSAPTSPSSETTDALAPA